MMELEEGTRLDAGVYRALRDSVGWEAPTGTDDELQHALDLTWNVAARDPGGDVVGIGRLLEDGVLYATIWDMIVRPDWQRRGVGRMILERLLARAGSRTIVALVATPSGRVLYEQYGFRPESRGSVGMLLRPSQANAGAASSGTPST